jgi:hypothetical protein
MSSDSPVVILYNSSGEAISSIDVDSQKALAVSSTQNIKVSTGNSSTTNLAAGASFTGTSEEAFGVTAVQVMCKADKILSISIQQSTDNSNWDIADTFLLYPGQGNGRTTQVVGAYVRVVVTNISPAITTYLRLATTLCPVIEALPRSLTEAGTLPLASQTSSSSPDPLNFTEVGVLPSLKVDLDGNLITRGQILTDEQSFRDDFTDGAIATVLSGTLTFSASVYVVGVSTSFLSEIKIGDYVKLDSDPQAALTVVSDVMSDTLLILEQAYLGTPGTGASSRAAWFYQSGGTGSVGYSTSVAELISGTTPGSHSTILRPADYPPFNGLFVIKIDNRYANQVSSVGFMNTAYHLSDKIAALEFSGTDNTKVSLVTSFNSDDKETTIVTLPDSGVTSDYHEYYIEVTAATNSLWVDGVKLATHSRHIIGPYDEVQIVVGIGNFGVVTGSSTLSADVVYFSNFNRIETIENSIKETINPVNDRPPESTVSNVASAVADTELLDLNLLRSGAAIYNDSTSAVFLKLGTGASSTSYTVKMKSRDYYEVPYGYTGAVHAYWVEANGYARITEVF